MNKLKVLVRQIFKPKTTTIMGVRIITDRQVISKTICKAIYREKYEDKEALLVQECLRPEDRVLEIGGGIGLVSLLCAKIVGDGNVQSFEPNPRAVEIIRKNYALNNMKPNINCAAVTLHDGEVKFHFNDNIISSSLIERENSHPVSVPSRNITNVITSFQPTVVVMDAEGAEIELLPNCAHPDIRAMLVELHPHIVGEAEIQSLVSVMDEKGYFIEKRRGEKIVMFHRK